MARGVHEYCKSASAGQWLQHRQGPSSTSTARRWRAGATRSPRNRPAGSWPAGQAVGGEEAQAGKPVAWPDIPLRRWWPGRHGILEPRKKVGDRVTPRQAGADECVSSVCRLTPDPTATRGTYFFAASRAGWSFVALIDPSSQAAGTGCLPTAARSADRDQSPGAQQPGIGDHGRDPERGPAPCGCQLGVQTTSPRERQAPPGQRERHSPSQRAHRQRSGQCDPQHAEAPHRDANRIAKMPMPWARSGAPRGRVRSEQSRDGHALSQRAKHDTTAWAPGRAGTFRSAPTCSRSSR